MTSINSAIAAIKALEKNYNELSEISVQAVRLARNEREALITAMRLLRGTHAANVKRSQLGDNGFYVPTQLEKDIETFLVNIDMGKESGR